jgi:hypothetical protein
LGLNVEVAADRESARAESKQKTRRPIWISRYLAKISVPWVDRSDLQVEAEKEPAYFSSHDPEFAIVEARLEESVAMINVHMHH